MAVIRGEVSDVRFVPGDGLVLVSLSGQPGFLSVLAKDPAAFLSFDGRKVTAAELVDRLYGLVGRVSVLADPVPGMYCAARVAAFRTVV